MAEIKGFWSYVHADDEADGGRITRLAKDVAAEFEMLTGEKIDLFLDKDAISWGEDWRNKIDESLASGAFFIPVMTPRYFMSAECRRELHFFALRAKNLGIEELVLPLLYVDVPSLHEDEPYDDLVALVKPFQWEDWCDLRFADIGSEEYRRGVTRLAQRLVEANTKADEADLVAAALQLEPSTEDGDDSPGLLDQLAAAEEALPEWEATLGDLTQEITLIGEIVQVASATIERANAQGKGFAARLTIARQLARRLHEPADNVLSLGNKFASQLHEVDAGIRVLMERAPSEVRESPESRSNVCAYFDSIQQLSAAAREALGEVQGMIDAISPVEAMSRDLREPLKRLRQGLTLMVEAREVTDEWIQLIEDTGIDCDGAASTPSP